MEKTADIITTVANGDNSIFGGNREIDRFNDFAQFTDLEGNALSYGAFYTTLCANEQPFADEQKVSRGLQQLRPEIRETIGITWEDLRKTCSLWPVQAADAVIKQPISNQLPVLILAREINPTSPLSYAERVSAMFPNSSLVVFSETGHPVTFQSDACGLALVSAFVANPSEKPSARCAARH